MATRLLSRRAMREQQDHVEQAEPTDAPEADSDADDGTPVKKKRTRKAAAEKPPKEKAPAKPRVRKKTVKAPPRMCARWAVFDNGMKQVAVFDYKDRADADAKLVEVRERKAGSYFLRMVKEPYTPPAAAEPAAAVAV
jgi:hypothetical protein